MFDRKRTYRLGDPELEVLGSRAKLAAWRHRNVGPAWIKCGKTVFYLGSDLLDWIEIHRTDPNKEIA